MKSYWFIILIPLFVFSCYQEDENIQLERIDYIGDEIRIDGYYVHQSENSQGPLFDIHFLYRNGIILYVGSIEESQNINQYISSLKSEVNVAAIQNDKAGWGVFQINNEKIEFEKWYPTGPPIETFVRSGIILNDSTFHIKRSFKPDGSENNEKDEIYSFVEYSEKPDSTNSFIN